MTLNSPSAAYAPVHGGYPGTVPAPEDEPTFVKALVVHPDGKHEHVDLDPTLDTLTELVGGPIEFVFVTHGVHAYVNEEGKLWGLPPNSLATLLAGRLGVDMLVGTAVFLGDGLAGEEGDLPEEWLSL